MPFARRNPTAMNPSFNAAIIGLGQIGMGYDLGLPESTTVLSHARALSLHDNFNLIAAVEPCANKRSVFEQYYSLPAFDSLKQLQKKSDASFDLFIIATPTDFHSEVLDEILKHFTPKLIICEKPFMLDKHQAEEAIAQCNAANCKLLINYIRRSEPGTKRCSELIHTGKLGAIEKAVVWYSKGLKHNGSHFVDLLNQWLGDFQSARVIRAELLGNDDIASDALLQWGNTAVYLISRKEQNYSYYSIELDGTKGRLNYDDGGLDISWRSVASNPNFSNYQRLSNKRITIPNDMLRYQLHAVDDWFQLLSNRPFLSCRGEEGLLTQHIVESLSDQTKLMIRNNHDK